MKRLATGLLALGASVSLTGCVIVISDEEPSGVHWAAEYDDVQGDHYRARNDAAQGLLDDVRANFEADEFVRNEDILIAARDGVVTLSGEATSVDVVDRAVGLASAVNGVESVVSRVVVIVN